MNTEGKKTQINQELTQNQWTHSGNKAENDSESGKPYKKFINKHLEYHYPNTK